MKQITLKDQDLSQAALEGMDAFVQVFIDALRNAIGGEPTPETLAELNADQMTLLCWDTLHTEVCSGGFVQLIHNGYGPFIFKNPFAKALNKMWGMRELGKRIYELHTLWSWSATAQTRSSWPSSSDSRSSTTTTTGSWRTRKNSPSRWHATSTSTSSNSPQLYNPGLESPTPSPISLT